MAHGVTPEALEQALRRTPEARAAFIVSPTYYGMAADVEGCARVAHAAGAALVVDNAWGAHFGFHPRLPASPLELGADAMLASTHKIVGSLTQSAMLMVASTELIDTGAVARAVRLVRSTSPSSLLMASLDAARRQLAVHGEALLERTIRASENARAAIDAVDGLLGRRGGAGRPAGDRRLGPAPDRGRRPRHRLHGLRGRRRAARVVRHLRRAGDARDARAGARARADGRPARAARARLRRDRPRDRAARRDVGGGQAADRARARDAIAPRDAFLGEGEAVPVDQAVGRISAESIAGYPPGVPALLPGERVTAEVVAYLRELTSAGARLHGAADPSFATVRVLVTTN